MTDDLQSSAPITAAGVAQPPTRTSAPAETNADGQSPDLVLDFHGRIIEHLGLQMYQSPTAALAELVSNAWDADAEKVQISLPADVSPEAIIVIQDYGNGMTLKEVQQHYLKVGLNRRGRNASERSRRLDRAVLGRKGIGKFAGFGIARRIQIETVSRETGEKTVFELDYARIRGDSEEYVDRNPFKIPGASYDGPDVERVASHGTRITLCDLSIARRPPADQLRKSMSRRFSFGASLSNFVIEIDGEEVAEDADATDVQFSFPRDYAVNERPRNLCVLDGDEWGVEALDDGKFIRWRYRFYTEPINEAELIGVAVFASGKIAQMPFMFNLAGGLGGQHGAAYLAGRVEANFLDSLPRDLIAPERQRVDWEATETTTLLHWGQKRTRELLLLWKTRRGQGRQRRLAEKMAPVEAILNTMRLSESRPLRTLLARLASIESIDDPQFLVLSEALVTAWKAGRLKDLIERLGDAENLDEIQVVQVLLEANVISDLQMAEIVKTRIGVVHELRRRIEGRELEGTLRDFIAEHPELVSPQWTTFRKEMRVNRIIENALLASGIETDEEFRGRLDLAMSSGNTLLVLEFMRPGLTLDMDHIQRFQRYIAEIKPALAINNVMGLTEVVGYLVADNTNRRAAVLQMIADMKANEQFVMTWDTLLAMAEDQWREHMEILQTRSDDDERIRELRN